MTSLEQAVVELVRLGLKGDAASVRRYARRLLRTVATDLGSEHVLCRQLSGLLSAQSSAEQLARGVPQAARSNLPAEIAPLLRLDDFDNSEAPILSRETEAALQQLLAERNSLVALQGAGLEPTKTVLLVGPPGVGKTMAARFCAAALGLPLLSIELGPVMSSYLGRSGQNLREAIAYARTSDCVFLIDEFDAIAKRRDDPADVGELKRVVNLLLLELDQWPSSGLLLAATNHPELLDRAVWRRFDRVIEVSLPNEDARMQILKREVGRYNLPIDPVRLRLIVTATAGISGADLVRMVQVAARASVMGNGQDAIGTLVREAMGNWARLCQSDNSARTLFCRVAHDELKWTQRQIADELGVTHVAVGKRLKDPSKPAKRARASRETQ